jgi:hypothetical protein
MWDLLEHVKDPVGTLEKARNLLKPNGYILISTGDVDSLMARVSGRFWHLIIPPFHLYYFSQRTIRRYLAEAGFTEIQIRFPGKTVALDFIVEKAIRMVSPGLAKKLAPAIYRSWLRKLTVPINLFDIMTLSARKAE